MTTICSGTHSIDLKKSLCYIKSMSMIDEIRKKFVNGQYEYSKHAVDQSIIRHISTAEIQEAMLSKSEIIEDYPDDKYGSSCLVLGFTNNGRPLHMHVSYPSGTILKVVTAYQPDESKWMAYRIRRK